MSTTLKVSGGTGLTSCLSVRLDQAVKHHHATGRYPDAIDSTSQFWLYAAEPGHNVSAHILEERVTDIDHGYRTDFDHGWQYAWYDQLDLDGLGDLAHCICRPLPEVRTKAMSLAVGLPRDCCGILYRGNDKAKEIPATPYEEIIAQACMSGFDRFHVQTDEQEFLDACRKALPNVTWWDHLPRIQKNPESYVAPPFSIRPKFAQDFLAALIAMGYCEGLIMTTGNTALWTMLYRGHATGAWQYHAGEGKGRNLTNKRP